MKARELVNLGVPRGPASQAAQRCCAAAARAGADRAAIREAVRAVVAAPAEYFDDPGWRELAEELTRVSRARAVAVAAGLVRDDDGAPFKVWGEPGEDFDHSSLDQLKAACRLPVARAGALMPDAHVGYGLPIGGVLATEGAVVPYAVGVDIACRVKLTVLDLPADTLESDAGRERLTRAIETETRFGLGASFGGKGDRGSKPREHPVLDDDWSVSPVTLRMKDKARKQLGTSGSGNHFVEFGFLDVGAPDPHRDFQHVHQPDAAARRPDAAAGSPGDHPFERLEPGRYLALLSHSGSRGPGAAVCDHYSALAIDSLPGLSKDMARLAWLDLSSEAGEEYWRAMELMGRFASANHACIHDHIARRLGARAVADVENHHNFAWKEVHDFGDGPREYIVHRKGATPAHAGLLGVIPGTMADPTFVVRGLADSASIGSASHGAGRVMSRGQAKRTFRWAAVRPMLKQRNVTLLSAGIDENPNVYKDIRRVIGLQRDLVQPIATFQPRLVKMAPEGERAED